MACHISTETSRQVETIKGIIDAEYINLVGKNSHAILGYPMVLLGLTSMTNVDQQSPPLALMATQVLPLRSWHLFLQHYIPL